MLLKEEDSDYWKDNLSSYYIHHLATDINKKGIGKLLTNFAIEQCKKDNKSRLRLDCYKTSLFLNDYYKKLGCASSVNPTANVIKQAPILVLVFREKNDNWIIGDNLSIGACVENMCLRATDLGIGSLWIRDIVYVSEDVAKMLGHGDLELNCAVSFGVPNQNPKQRPRKELKDIMEWY